LLNRTNGYLLAPDDTLEVQAELIIANSSIKKKKK
jgi:hypothetical protein